MKKAIRWKAMKFPSTQRDEGSVDAQQELASDDESVQVQRMQQGEQLDGSLETNPEEKRLAHTVLDIDTDVIKEGMLVQEAFNRSLNSFLPDMLFNELVNNYKNAKQLYGETIIRELTGYDSRYVDKNIKIPEFQRELQKRLKDRAEELHEQGILKKGGRFTQEALVAAALFLIDEEFKQSHNAQSTFGEEVHKTAQQQGERSDVRPYRKEDVYKDIAIRESVSRAIKRGRGKLEQEDLHAFDREARQQVNIVYALDISGSMKGEKIRLAKKAGVSLAHRAIKDSNAVGLVLFGHKIQTRVALTKDFYTFVSPLATCMPSNETDIALALQEATQLLSDARGIKHIVVLTDGLHTTSKDPERVVLEQASETAAQEITISVVGVNLDDIGLALARKMVDVGRGRLYAVKDLEDVGGVVIADYKKLL